MNIVVYKTMLDGNGGCELVEDRVVEYECEEEMDKPERVYRMLCDVFKLDRQTEEYLYLLCLGGRCRLLGVFEVSHGTAHSTLAGLREIFQKALLCNACYIILAHNHPSSRINPSREDVELCKTVKQAADFIGVPLLDNVIVGESYYSFHEHELC